MELDITGLKDFEHTVHAVINSAEELNNLKTKVKNQRKTLNQQNEQINDLKASLSFDKDVLSLKDAWDEESDEQYSKMIDKYTDLKKRYKLLKNNDSKHLSKLIQLQHILNRDSDSEAMEFH